MSLRVGSSEFSKEPERIEGGEQLETLLKSLLQPYYPLEPTLALPNPDVDIAKASSDIIRKNELRLSSSKPNQENEEILKTVDKKNSSLLAFAKNHPFLTAGFLVGIIFLICAFPSLAAAFASKLGITIMHAKMIIGIGVGVTALYYGVYLINLARTTSVKDSLQQKIEGMNELFQIQAKQTKTRVVHFIKSLSSRVEEIKKSNEDKIEKLQSARISLAEGINEQLASQQAATKTRVHLENIIAHDSFKSLPPDLQKAAEENLKKLSEGVKLGTEIVAVKTIHHPLEAGPLALPLLPLSEEILVPRLQSSSMQANAEVKASIGRKIAELLKNSALYVKNNALSSLLMSIGLVFALASIPALIYLLKGSSSVYLLGTLSASSVIQFVVYGVSMIYEGYNTAAIKKLQEQEAEVAVQLQENMQQLIREDALLKRAEDASSGSLASYREQWETVAYKHQEVYEKDVKSLRDQYSEITTECAYLIGMILGKLGFEGMLPSQTDMKRILDELAIAAEKTLKPI